MFLKVCRAFHRLPDEIRAVSVDDYFSMLESIGEVPLIDDAFYYAFCKGSDRKKKTDLTTPEGRKKYLESTERKDNGNASQ